MQKYFIKCNMLPSARWPFVNDVYSRKGSRPRGSESTDWVWKLPKNQSTTERKYSA